MSVRYNYEPEVTGILLAIAATGYDEATDAVASWLNDLDQLAARHGIEVEPDWQFSLRELE